MFKHYIEDETGGFAITSAATMLPMMVVISVAVDFGKIESQKLKLQDALDTATMASTVNEEVPEGITDGKTLFGNQTSSLPLNDIHMNITFDDGTYTGTVTAQAPILFSKILGRQAVEISARTVISKKANGPASPCIMALSTDRQRGITFNSGANVNAPKCAIEISSTKNPSAVINSGAALNVSKTCIAGSQIVDNNHSVPNLELECPTISDPFAGLYPVPDSSSCDFNQDNYNGAVYNFSPGTYCGSHNFNNGNASITFAPGLYVIKGGAWNVNGGNWNGDGVTFYFADDKAKIQFNSGVKATFTPPETGDYAGVFMTETKWASKKMSNFILNDSKGFDFEGIVYLPNRNLIMNSGVTIRSRSMILAADTMIINDANLNFATELPPIGGDAVATAQAYFSQ